MKTSPPKWDSTRVARLGVACLLLSFMVTFAAMQMLEASSVFGRRVPSFNMTSEDELETALKGASMEKKILIISILNEAYVEENGMLDLFLRSLREGEDTQFLIKHLLLVAVDNRSFEWCKFLGLHCYQLVTEDADFSKEVVYMSDGFIQMMWRRTRFLGDVLKRGYSFIFTDIDVLWLRNPLAKLNLNGDGLQISCDGYNGQPLDYSNSINTGFYYVASNNRTIALYDEWNASRNNSAGMKEQDVLSQMIYDDTFKRLGIKVRFLDTLYFSGFCQDSRDFKEVRTVHANCCRYVKAKVVDLMTVLETWKRFNGTSTATWPAHKECHDSWKNKDELDIALERASMENKTVIISVLNKAYVKENGMLDLFLQAFRQGENTEFLIKHVLLVAMDQIAFDRCKLLELNCYQLVTEGVDFSEEQLYMSDDFIKMMWQRTLFLEDVLKRGYNFIFTDMDVLWLRNPLARLNLNGEDLQISCDGYNGQPLDYSNPINTGFYFVASNNKTIGLYDEWYASRNNSAGMKEQDVLSRMKSDGTFRRLGITVRFLDTLYFSGFCQDSRDFREVRTVHANCCRYVKAKVADMMAVLETWKRFNGISTATWPAHKECHDSWQTKDELEIALERASMENKTMIISVLNKAYAKENGMLDLFLQGFRQGENTEFLIKHLLLVAVDQIAFDRCKQLELNCYRLVTEGVDFLKEQLYMSDGFIKMMWQRTLFLGDVLKRGYSFILTDMDVMWLRNPFAKLNHEGEDMQISCDGFNGKPFDTNNSVNTGFYYVASNNKTIALFDAWYKARNNSTGMKEQDVLLQMKSAGVFKQLGMKVRFLDTLYFSGFCGNSKDIKQVITVHANCCRTVKAKLTDLAAILAAWRRFNGTTPAEWSKHEACSESWKVNITI